MPTIPAELLTTFVAEILDAAGTSTENARVVSQSLVDANLDGHDTHGVMRLQRMLRIIKAGQLKPNAEPFILRETPVIAVVDGAWTFGQIGARFAANLAVQKAKISGLAAVSAVRCHHTGRMSEWVEIGVREGLVAFAATATGNDLSAVAPFGGAKGSLGTNPLGWGIPRSGDQPPIIADISTGAASIGEMQMARARGATLPEGLIIDAEARPSTDPEDFFNGGSILAMGGRKGSALSVIVEMLTIAMGGGDQVPTDVHSQALFMICVDPAAFWPDHEYEATVERIAQRIKATPPAPGVGEVLLPGERSSRTRQERLATGIPLPARTWEMLCTAAIELEVIPPPLTV